MATFTSYTSPFHTGKGKENLEARINLLSQTETPFYSSVGRGTTTTPQPQLIEEELNNIIVNANVEGFDFPAGSTSDPISPTVDGDVRRQYSTQIFAKTVRVTGTQQANDTVSVTGKKELAEQLALRGMELKRDVEWNCVGDKSTSNNDNGVTVTAPQLAGYAYGGGVGSATAARQITDYLGQTSFSSSASAATGGTPAGSTVGGAGAGLNRGTGATAGTTAQPISETVVNNVARNLYASGGLSYNMGNSMVKNANMMLLAPGNKQRFDTILDAKVSNYRSQNIGMQWQGRSYTKYATSFGDFSIMPDQFMDNGFGAMYNPQNWKWVTLRQMHTQEISKIGDSERRQLVMEGTLIHRHTDASGAILGLTGS